jgi:hypothetical protein
LRVGDADDEAAERGEQGVIGVAFDDALGQRRRPRFERDRVDTTRAARAATQLRLAAGPGVAAGLVGAQLDPLDEHVDEGAERAGADRLHERVGDADADLGGGSAEAIDEDLPQARRVVDDRHQRGDVEAGAAR